MQSLQTLKICFIGGCCGGHETVRTNSVDRGIRIVPVEIFICFHLGTSSLSRYIRTRISKFSNAILRRFAWRAPLPLLRRLSHPKQPFGQQCTTVIGEFDWRKWATNSPLRERKPTRKAPFSEQRRAPLRSAAKLYPASPGARRPPCGFGTFFGPDS